MKREEFLTYYKNNTPQIMWFVGAGASARAGIKTAGEIIWDLKREIYCRAQSVDSSFLKDMERATLKHTIQAHLDSHEGFPNANSHEEYSFYLEYMYSDEVNCRDYINGVVKRGAPSLGHYVMAALGQSALTDIAWTTNFDDLIERAYNDLFGSAAKLQISSIAQADDLANHITKRRFPLLVKLHGDYQYKRLANTVEELATQNKYLKEGLCEAARTHGLAIIGYSGRDESIIQALSEALAEGKGFPYGVYWFQRRGEEIADGVHTLISKAKTLGVNFHTIEIDTFDQVMGDILDITDAIPRDVREKIYQRIPRYTPAKVPDPSSAPGNDFPVIRTNALPVLGYPNSALIVETTLGGKAELNQQISQKSADIVAFRIRKGAVVAGEPTEIAKVFGAYKTLGDKTWSLDDLRLESTDMGLLNEMLLKAFARYLPDFKIRKTRDAISILVDKTKSNIPLLDGLKTAIAAAKQPNILCGVIPTSDIEWTESLKCKLTVIQDQLYLLLKPTIYAKVPSPAQDASHSEIQRIEGLRFLANEFINKRLQPRYNSQYAGILDAWIKIFGGDRNTVITLPVFEGETPVFQIQNVTAFSNKGRAR